MQNLINLNLFNNITALLVVKKMSMGGGIQNSLNPYQIKENKELIYKNRHIRTW